MSSATELQEDTIKNEVDILALVITRMNSSDKRATIREMFNYIKTTQVFKPLFLFGHDPQIEENLSEILEESQKYKDLIVPNVEDNYHTVALKLLSAFHWIGSLGSTRLKWIIKMDDDVYINVTKFDEYFQNQNLSQKDFHCYETYTEPVRNPNR